MGSTWTPAEAALTFAQATRWEEGLVQRTEGLTWMTWGTVTAGILMTLGFLERSGVAPALVVAGWSAWVVIGFAFTFTIWRTAALARPDLGQATWYAYLLRAGAIGAAVLVLHLVVRPETIAGPMVLIGIAWSGASLLVRRLSVRGRRLTMVSGACIMLGAGALEAAAWSMTATMLTGTALLAGVPLLLGLYQATSG